MLEERDHLPYLKCRPVTETLANKFETQWDRSTLTVQMVNDILARWSG
jgi:hypothetical protein